jgi:hypothetical protein
VRDPARRIEDRTQVVASLQRIFESTVKYGTTSSHSSSETSLG